MEENCKQPERRPGHIVFIRSMEDEIRFLRQKAEQLRAIARSEPHLADDLRRMAGEMEEMADRLSGRPPNGTAAHG